MLELRNRTPFRASLIPWLDQEGIDHACIVIKGTFSLSMHSGTLPVADEQALLVRADEFHGEPTASSIQYTSDTTPLKPGTDVALLGHAHAPPGGRCRSMEVLLRVGHLKKAIRVMGNRVWFRSLMTWQMTPPGPFERIPLIYERAFGGLDDTSPEGPVVEMRNPVGTGFAASSNTKRLEGLLLPNLEDERELITSPRSRPTPVGFGFVAAHWLPRRTWGGTYDEAWRRERCPFLPKDFDMRFLNAAPAPLIASPHLKGGETVQVSGASPQGVLRFTLPKPRLQVQAWLRTRLLEAEPILDTVTIEPDRQRVLLTWKAMFRCGQQTLHLSRVSVKLLEGTS
ncbi:DUF2169 family type VI secretion system accessory protein [Archangium lansingense]|uniref:DUF2169 family type VI secretion system accessory protein n=1 Tax=Archangium lansingense TaxID=2995310 RepID=UPI003B7FEAFE